MQKYQLTIQLLLNVITYVFILIFPSVNWKVLMRNLPWRKFVQHDEGSQYIV